jgi:hypothetical protein
VSPAKATSTICELSELTMIVGKSFIWLHLPKTGGSSFSQLLRKIDRDYNCGLVFDDDSLPLKHDSLELRVKRNPHFNYQEKKIFITIRRLDAWLVSDWYHKRNFNGLNLSWVPVQYGLYYSNRLGGVWTAADWWLKYFNIDKHNFYFLRTEYLCDDIKNILIPQALPSVEEKAIVVPRVNENPTISAQRLSIDDKFQTLFREVNPSWARIEEELYP